MTDSVIAVKVGTIGASSEEFNLEGDATVADALEAAGLDEGAAVYVNRRPADTDTELMDGDSVVVMPLVKGGNC